MNIEEPTGKELRDAGCALVEENTKDDYRASYHEEMNLAFMRLRIGDCFRVEQLHDKILPIIGRPHHHNSLSSMSRKFVNWLLSEDRIRLIGGSLSTRPSSHAHFAREYEKIR